MKQLFVLIAIVALVGGCAVRKAAPPAPMPTTDAPESAMSFIPNPILHMESVTSNSPANYKIRLWASNTIPDNVYMLSISPSLTTPRTNWTDYLFVFGSSEPVLVERVTSRDVAYRYFSLRWVSALNNFVQYNLPDRDSQAIPSEIYVSPVFCTNCPVNTNAPTPPLPARTKKGTR